MISVVTSAVTSAVTSDSTEPRSQVGGNQVGYKKGPSGTPEKLDGGKGQGGTGTGGGNKPKSSHEVSNKTRKIGENSSDKSKSRGRAPTKDGKQPTLHSSLSRMYQRHRSHTPIKRPRSGGEEEKGDQGVLGKQKKQHCDWEDGHEKDEVTDEESPTDTWS
ncbi:hypothetical protein ACOMHN_045882 [Nucella lapillus]